MAMDFPDPNQFDIAQIYRLYCEITSGVHAFGDNGYSDDSRQAILTREALSQLLKFVDSRLNERISIFEEISKLMLTLNLMVDSHVFSRFYNFVFFICREQGQKSISVGRAITAWKLVLSGRFRLINQWCDFIEKNQRHNISEDTWRQLLAFSRCVHENLEGYDPEGAWPVLIDEFVDYMYRTMGSTAASLPCNCCDSQTQLIEDPLRGLKIFPGSKRKYDEDLALGDLETLHLTDSPNGITNNKRRLIEFPHKFGNAAYDSMEIVKQNNSAFGRPKSPRAVEGCLSKGFEGLFSNGSRMQLDRRRKAL